MRDVGTFQQTRASANGVWDGWIFDMRNETKPIAVKSVEGAERGANPLLSGRLRKLR